MDYAIQLLLPIIGGLLLGNWLTSRYGVSPIWTLVLAILGMVGGLGIMYKRFMFDKPLKKITPKSGTVQGRERVKDSGLHPSELDFLYRFNEKGMTDEDLTLEERRKWRDVDCGDDGGLTGSKDPDGDRP